MRVEVISHGETIRWKKVTQLKWHTETHVSFKGARDNDDDDDSMYRRSHDDNDEEEDDDDRETKPIIRTVEVSAPVIVVEG